MLAMTQKILQWLQDNEDQLQDIDYADEISDHCDEKILVYSRRDGIEFWKKTGTKRNEVTLTQSIRFVTTPVWISEIDTLWHGKSRDRCMDAYIDEDADDVASAPIMLHL